MAEPDLARINNTLGKMGYHLANHNSICVSVSGGSDSDIIVHMIAKYFRQYLYKTHFVFCNTGLEYRATREHLDYLRQKYDIQIDEVRGESVVSVVRRCGVPILSKEFSERVSLLQNGAKSGIAWLNKTEGLFAPTPAQKKLAVFCKEQKISVSSRCCELSKKRPLKTYKKQIDCDMDITGERRAEGGQRAVTHTNCFERKTNSKKYDKYMPLFFWTDETKAYYKEHEGIRYSDCYEIWGMKRTGCVGCPFNSRVGEELKQLQKYEPNLYRACMNVFGESYRLMDKFGVHRKLIFDPQQSFDFGDSRGNKEGA